MTPEQFYETEGIVDVIAEQLRDWLDDPGSQSLKGELAKLSKRLGLSINLELSVTAFEEARHNTLPLLQTGLTTRNGLEPYQFWADSAPMRYVAKGAMSVVPHDRCPICWSEWDFKYLHPACAACGARMGVDVQLLIDSDQCPSCEEGKVTQDLPKCDRCDFEVNPDHVNWG